MISHAVHQHVFRSFIFILTKSTKRIAYDSKLRYSARVNSTCNNSCQYPETLLANTLTYLNLWWSEFPNRILAYLSPLVLYQNSHLMECIFFLIFTLKNIYSKSQQGSDQTCGVTAPFIIRSSLSFFSFPSKPEWHRRLTLLLLLSQSMLPIHIQIMIYWISRDLSALTDPWLSD